MGRLIAKVNDVQFVTHHSFLVDLLIWSKPHFFIIGNTTTTEVDFFDSAFTFTNESIEVGCCSPNTTLTKVTCGQGTSCTGECSAIGASLCPSGTCTEDPEDCSPSLLLEQASREDSSGKERSVASRPPWQLKWCAPGCSGFIEIYVHWRCLDRVLSDSPQVAEFANTLPAASIRPVGQGNAESATG